MKPFVSFKNSKEYGKGVKKREEFQIHEKVKKVWNDFHVMILGLTLFGLSHVYKDPINEGYDMVVSELQGKWKQVLGQNIAPETYSIVHNLFEEAAFQVGTRDVYSPELQEAIYEKLQEVKKIQGIDVVQSLILGFLYGFAYLQTIRRIKREHLKIDVKSFLTFSLTSGGMVMVNGLVPGSLVYLESFLLAGYAVFLHLQNTKVSPKNHEQKYFLYELCETMPMPVFAFGEKGIPLIWNKKLEAITGYSYEEVRAYFFEHGEIQSLLSLKILGDDPEDDLFYRKEYINFLVKTKWGKLISLSMNVLYGPFPNVRAMYIGKFYS